MTQVKDEVEDQVVAAIVYLDGVCDGAQKHDGQGFNGIDTTFGKSLAAQVRAGRTLSVKQIRAGGKMLQTYRKQLEAAGYALPTKEQVFLWAMKEQSAAAASTDICERCSGKGTLSFGNNRYPSRCYRCNGTGKLTERDKARNAAYDAKVLATTGKAQQVPERREEVRENRPSAPVQNALQLLMPVPEPAVAKAQEIKVEDLEF